VKVKEGKSGNDGEVFEIETEGECESLRDLEVL
jgi:hypothetical protein